MDRRDDLLVAGAAALGTLFVVAVSVLLSTGGTYVRALPLVVYFAYTVVHDPERGGLDQARVWIGLTGAVTLLTLVLLWVS
jgi:hypothetical protein